MGQMVAVDARAPGIRADYYQRIYEVEQRHWWHEGMRAISDALLGDRARLPGRRVLDAGCGTGGVLRWQLDFGGVASAAGVDVGSDAIELARMRVPEADLRVASLKDLPFEDGTFDLAFCNDVLQHVHELDVEVSLGELRRVLMPGGTLLLRTNGSLRLRRERDDWRAYDRGSLIGELERSGFSCERATYANVILSAWGAARGRVPHAPTTERDGIPRSTPNQTVERVGRSLLGAEARYLRRGNRLPYGHTLFALATPL